MAVAAAPPGRAPARLRQLVLAGGLVQSVHALEHALQMAVWVRRPGLGAWLTPWTAQARDGLAVVAGGAPLGTELLHLVGNAFFLAAAVAAVRLFDGVDELRRARTIQALHVLEHCALVLSVAAIGRPVGLTTALGLADPTSARMVAIRITAHFAINAVATWLFVAGLLRARVPGGDARTPRRSAEVDC